MINQLALQHTQQTHPLTIIISATPFSFPPTMILHLTESTETPKFHTTTVVRRRIPSRMMGYCGTNNISLLGSIPCMGSHGSQCHHDGMMQLPKEAALVLATCIVSSLLIWKQWIQPRKSCTVLSAHQEWTRRTLRLLKPGRK